MTTAINPLWLPEGRHWGLTISHRRLNDAGDFGKGKGNRIVWHTTEGHGIETMWNVLKNKNAASHFLIDPSAGDSQVYQMIPLNKAARSLQNDQGDWHETNKAGDHTIQIEIVDYARNAGNWGEHFYADLAALACLIDHRVDVIRNAPSFVNPKQMTDAAFEVFRGHCGHVHVPDNDHWDPGKLSTIKLFRHMTAAEKQYA